MGIVHNVAGDAVKGGMIGRFFANWGTRHLLYAVGALFVLDMLVPDPIPLLDELALAVIAILVARWQSRNGEETVVEPLPRDPDPGRELKNVTPSNADRTT